MVNVLDSIFLGLLKFGGVQNVDALESFCNKYNYAPNSVLTEAIRAYLEAVARYEQKKVEEATYGPSIKVGVNV
jgi:hypothetical protein